MQFNKQHHIAIIGSNYEKSMHFYRDILGLELKNEHHRPERDDTIITFHFADSEIELFIKPDSPQRVSYPEALGLRHLCFKTDNIQAAIEHLEHYGIECEPVRLDEFTGEKATFFRDPDGLPLELHE